MTCPDWRAALALREVDDTHAQWLGARAHMDTCPKCRRQALAADPTLVFAGAEVLRVSDGEVESIRRAVHAARRVRQTERALVRQLSGTGAGLVAAVLLAMVLLLPATTSPPSAPLAATTPSPIFADFWTSEASPLIEAIDRPQARIYQLGEDDLSVVMIVDESLDV